jgi:hypothetical protein
MRLPESSVPRVRARRNYSRGLLDSDIHAALTDWYRKRGFTKSDEVSDAFEKVASPIPLG